MTLIQRLIHLLFHFPLPVDKFPPRAHEINNDLSKVLKPGDVLLVRNFSDDFVLNIIKLFTNSPYHHAELHIKDGYTISANPTGLTYNDGLKHTAIDIVRSKKTLTKKQIAILEERAAKDVMKPYDLPNLFLFPFVTKRNATRFASSAAYICSEHVDSIYRDMGIDLIEGRTEPLTAPADFGFCDKLVHVGTFLNGKKMPEPHLNEFIDKREEGQTGIKFVKFLESLSLRDEYYDTLTKVMER